LTYDEAVGLAIYTNRKIRGVSQPELAEAMSVTASAVSRLEGGTTKTTVVHLRKIARRLSIPASVIVEDAERYFGRASQGLSVDELHRRASTAFRALSPKEQLERMRQAGIKEPSEHPLGERGGK
jgi:transcriptional regulator with XRE-family HTH domain